jgi:hypothetical protein
LHLRELDEARLIEISEAPALGAGSPQPTVEPGQLCGEDLIIGKGAMDGTSRLAGDQHIRTQEHATHLFEDKGVKLVGADPRLPTGSL